MRAVIYARVSTPKQAEQDKISIPHQIQKCTEAIHSHEWSLVHKPFVDSGISGRKYKERKALQEMLLLVRTQKVDLVVVYETDRLSRSMSVAQRIYDELDVFNVQIFSVAQPVEPKSPSQYDPLEDDSSYITRTISSMSAALDIRKMRRRRKIGMENRMNQGKIYGRPPYGYTYKYRPNGTKKLIPVPHERRIVQRIFSEYISEGKSMRAIARGLNADGIQTEQGLAWAQSAIWKKLRNPTYCGKVYWGASQTLHHPEHKDRRLRKPMKDWIIIDGTHPAIISEDDWSKAQELRESKKSYGKNYGKSPLLSGLVRCGLCGYSMYATGGGGSKSKPVGYYSYFSCSHYMNSGMCEKNSYLMPALEKDVLNQLVKISSNPKLLAKIQNTQTRDKSKDIQGEITLLEKQKLLLTKRLKKSRIAYEMGVDLLEEYQEHKETLQDRSIAVEAKLSQLRKELNRIKRAQSVQKHFLDLMSDVTHKLTEQPIEKQKLLLRSIIDRIEIKRRTFKIHFKF